MDCRVKPGNDARRDDCARMTFAKEYAMPRVVGIDHLVLSVGNFARSKDFWTRLARSWSSTA